MRPRFPVFGERELVVVGIVGEFAVGIVERVQTELQGIAFPDADAVERIAVGVVAHFTEQIEMSGVPTDQSPVGEIRRSAPRDGGIRRETN